MSSLLITEFLIDDENELKFASHGLAAAQVDQVLDNPYLVARNRRERRASHLVIGKDHGGQCIAVPIEPTHIIDLWRPITAWPCKASELTLLTRRNL